MLREISEGSATAPERLMPLVYDELRRIAQSYLKSERPGHTLQATALVNEAYIRLVDWQNETWQNRAHFLGVAAGMMRRILVDYARERRAQKRGAGQHKITLNEAARFMRRTDIDLVRLDEALETLARFDPQQSRIIELRFFGGLTIEETAHHLKVSPATVKREWTVAKAWLHREISGDR
jgi:RNA polymerase sigma factor (TIGR02999 family)